MPSAKSSSSLLALVMMMAVAVEVIKDKLEEAANLYVECIDDALENSDASGSDEVIEIVEYMKKHHPKLFK